MAFLGGIQRANVSSPRKVKKGILSESAVSHGRYVATTMVDVGPSNLTRIILQLIIRITYIEQLT